MTAFLKGALVFLRENARLLTMLLAALVTGLSTIFFLLIAPRVYGTLPPTETDSLTPTTPHATRTPTASASFTPTSSATPTRSPSETPVVSLEVCDQPTFPCLYFVRSGDTFTSVASELYGNPALSTIIKAANRNADGTYPRLVAGSMILLPRPNQTPIPGYPQCSSPPSLPCVYQVDLPLFEFNWLATAFYGSDDPELISLIVGANLDIGDIPRGLLEAGDIVIVPALP